MARKLTAKQQAKVNSARVERAFSHAGTPVNIFDLSKISAHGREAIEANPSISDEDLDAVILAFVTDLVAKYPENLRKACQS